MKLSSLFNWFNRPTNRRINTTPTPTIVATASIPTIDENALDNMKNIEQQKSAVYGCILGQAIGDALGHPCEFNHSVGKRVPPMQLGAQFTDDSQMMYAIAQALLQTPPHVVGMEMFMSTLAAEFANWMRNPLGGSHRLPGGACSSACSALGRGVDWRKSGGLSSKGNGTAMRSSVVGAYYHRDLRMAWQVGCMTSIPTHNNLESILMAGTVSLLCACGVRGIPYARAISMVLRNIESWETSVLEYPKTVKIGSGYNDQNPWYAAARIGEAYSLGRVTDTETEFSNLNGDDFATVPATAAAVYYNSRHSNYRDVVLNCISNTADADTTGAISGAIAGSRFTAQFIPQEWRANVELSNEWHKLAEQVWAASQTVTDPTADTNREVVRTR